LKFERTYSTTRNKTIVLLLYLTTLCGHIQLVTSVISFSVLEIIPILIPNLVFDTKFLIQFLFQFFTSK